MKEIESEPMAVVITRLVCDCGNSMAFMCEAFDMNPPSYVYRCPDCGSTHTSQNRYPIKRYVPLASLE